MMSAEVALKPDSMAVPTAVESTPEAVVIPAHAVGEDEFTVTPRQTLDSAFARLASGGHAWCGPDGKRYYDAAHPQVRKYLEREAGIADAAWSNASPPARKLAQDWCRFLERAESAIARDAGSLGRVAAAELACKNLGPELLGQWVSVPTFYARLKRYKAARRRRSSQLDGRSRPIGRQVIDQEAWGFFLRLYLTPHQRGIRSCWEATKAQADKLGWFCPGYRALVRRVDREWPAAKADYYRLGEREWRKRHAPKIVRDKSDLPGNHTWEIDHARLDFWAREGNRRERLWITLIVDRGSDLLVGWSITTNPSSDSLAQAPRRAVTTCGAPLETVLDNGRDMLAGSFGGKQHWVDPTWAGNVFDQLGVELHICQPFSPWAKGVVEGLARTIHERFCKSFASYCGGEPADKPQGIDKWCAENVEKLPSTVEVEQRFSLWVQAFSERPSDAVGIAPLSPRQRFEQTRIARRTLPDDVLNMLLLKLTGPRKVTSKGVMHNGLRYTDDFGRLFDHQGRQVRLRVDPDDISYVWVCDVKGKPLFRAVQNYVKGDAVDVRKAAQRRKRARQVVEEARRDYMPALDDIPTAIMRAQVERYQAETAGNEPPDGSPAAAVAPITTATAQEVLAAAEAIDQAKRETLRPAIGAEGLDARRRLREFINKPKARNADGGGVFERLKAFADRKD